METFKLYRVNKNLYPIEIQEIECYRQTDSTYWKVGSKYSDRKDTNYAIVFDSKQLAIDYLSGLIDVNILRVESQLKRVNDLKQEFNKIYGN